MGAMIARPSTPHLFLFTAVVLGAAGLLLGHGTPDSPRGASRPHATATPIAPATAATTSTGASALAARVRVARAYALAATNWSAVSFPAAYRRQFTLASGELRRQLRAHAPGSAQLRQLGADGATRLGVVLDARSRPARSPVAGKIVLRVAEQRELAGRRTHTSGRYLVRLHRHAGRWHVVGFTAIRGRP
jgi:hypothetical protein